ncbi:hypothetical protein CHS0354_037371 [Potamilus streckersoni]|uniref:PLAT domain-containing protein n=1 Tax=Potamilus streckersoni TaxID=2493646 RepID=A0AAE0VNR3_9BIVA|nr:hypothetical protein CHS0354_037371 [Potamilus streckersoni]
MSSEKVAKAVGKKLRHYFEVKRLEDGFDLSLVNAPLLDHPPLKSRATLQYDGLHDRALKHYFSIPEVKVQLTQMNPNTSEINREKLIKKIINYYMTKRFVQPTVPDYMYVQTGKGKKLRPEYIGFGIPLKSKKRKVIKGGWPTLRSVPSHYVNRKEGLRLINTATKLLVATETVGSLDKVKVRNQSAPSPFEDKPRPSTAKFTWDTDGRRHQAVKAYDDSYIQPKKPEPPRMERPKSSKYRPRPIITVPETIPKESVGVVQSTQTADSVGIQTERRLLEEYDPMEDEVKDGPWAEYQVYVRTGSRVGASTEAFVKMAIYGDKGRTKDFALTDSSTNKIKFQRGREDKFILAAHHVGKIKKIRIGHDRPELRYAWFLEGVTVYDMYDKKIYDFNCNQWLSGTDGDRKTYRVLEIEMERSFIEDYNKEKPDIKIAVNKTAESEKTKSSSSSGHPSKDKISNVSVHGSELTRNDSDSSESSTGSTSSYTYTTGSTASVESVGKNPQKDAKSQENKGPTFSFPKRKKERLKSRARRDSEARRKPQARRSADSSTSDSDTTVDNKKDSSDSEKAKPEKEYLTGYKAGLEAAEVSRKEKEKKEDTEKKKLLSGPTIHDAAQAGDLDRVQKLIQHFPELKEKKDDKGYTPLHRAAQHGRVDVVKCIANVSTNLNMETQTGYTAIHIAAMNGHVNCLMVLAALGAAITCRTIEDQTPLHLAAMGGHIECVKWLIANRANLDTKDSMGRTPLHLAEVYKHKNVADFLRNCEQEQNNPKSSLAAIRNKSGNMSPIEEDTQSTRSGRSLDQMWKENSTSTQRGPSLDKKWKADEKKKMYEEQHQRMEESGTSFLDSIREEVSNKKT